MTGCKAELKVLIAIPDLCGGGTERQTLQLARVLKEAGHSVTVVCLFGCYERIAKEFQGCGVSVLCLRYTHAIRGASLISRLFALFLAHRPDVVHVQYSYRGFSVLLGALLAGVGVRFATVHQMADRYGFWHVGLMRVASHLSTRFHCVSRAVEQSWFGSSTNFASAGCPAALRHATIYNVVDVENITRVIDMADACRTRRVYNIENVPLVASVGRLSRVKGTDVLLKAFKQVLSSVPDAQLVLIGEELECFAVGSTIESCGLIGKVVHTGWLPPDEIAAVLALVQVVVVPSREEGFSLAAAEAMAARKPVVASRTGGLAEVVEDKVTGLLVEPGNACELTRALSHVLLDPVAARTMGEHGRERAQKLFSPRAFRDAILLSYKSATSKAEQMTKGRRT